ncbi:hypothetical protein JRO89_XS05G0121600 [Xanthoceras sorbifolium]|uniref:YTH domain-containing family protein n=1 Tax=Xanthoceras sorbifolium TaxID=99658 RepID=A0ABQ8I1N7_9ROSI|nr:hypothetical protein JRO89_XS05G0121600 [Xanthoceras sorbifolium]
MANKDKTLNPNMLNSQDAVTIGSQRDYVDQSGSLSSVGYHKTGYVPSMFSPQAPSVCSGAVKQGAPLPYGNAEGLDNGSHGILNESSSVAYGYSPHMLSRPYIPIAKQLPSARGHDHLYNERELSLPDPSCYQQPVSPNSSYILSPTQVSQAKLPVHVDLQGNGKRFGLRSSYSSPLGSSGWGDNSFPNSSGLNFLHQGYEGGIWSDWAKPLNVKKSLLQLPLAAPSLKPTGSLSLSGDDFGMVDFLPASQQKGSFYGFGSCSGSSYRRLSLFRSDLDSDYRSVSTSSMGMDGQKWPTLNEARQGGKCNDFSCSCTVTLDTISERNRGPRAFKPKVQMMENGSALDSSKNGTIDGIPRVSYNRLDFVTDYKDAKFFIIKSYSEDNVHKSIKYGVWASTANGNRKLDAAYHEAREKQGTCPIFLLFSVNASAQFCGVAEMVGPVDFDKSVGYWLQDKWSGQFPVKWHLIKDVPNSQFRHILLENNDNKPVTNSRDTQEVEMDHGIEMLKIFKNYEVHSSILDDFYFYEHRQRAMQERKARPRQQGNPVAPPVVVVSEQQNPISLSNDFVKKMSKSFAEAVSLSEHEKEQSSVKKVITSRTASLRQGS